ncbi:hypothetical protein KKB83_01540 [Patescibacteria group bacterium]|nr:hypothetical protein [Patescibacteria group bacterium]
MPFRAYSKHHTISEHHFKLTESGALYLTHAIRSFALSLVGIFIPIFIFTLPNKIIFISDTILNNIIWVLLFFGIRSLTACIATFLFSRLMFLKLHLKKSILVSVFLASLQLLSLISVEHFLDTGPSTWSLVVLLAGIINGTAVFFYWIPFHIFFARKADTGDKKFGRETSLRYVVNQMASVAGPLAGGLIISHFGYDPLLISSILLLIISAIPALISIDERQHHEHNPVHIIKEYILSRRFRKTTLAFTGSGIEAVIYAALWPILVYIVLENFTKIGALTSLSILISSLAVLWVGKLTDRKGPKLIHRIGVFFNTLFYLPRMFLTTAPVVYTLDIFDRLNGTLYGLPFMSIAYERARELGTSDFIIYRELSIHFPMAITAGFCILLLFLLPHWQWLFLLAAVGSAMTYLMSVDLERK